MTVYTPENAHDLFGAPSRYFDIFCDDVKLEYVRAVDPDECWAELFVKDEAGNFILCGEEFDTDIVHGNISWRVRQEHAVK